MSNLDQEIAELLEQTEESPETAPSTQPQQYQAPIKGNWFNSGGFTYSTSPSHPKGHPGVDMRALGGTGVYPLTDGVVKNVGNSSIGGNFVKIQHSDGLSSYYAHFGTVNVQEGQQVNKNTVIGTVGNTGSAAQTFPHVHLEVYKNNKPVDPAQFFYIPPYTDPKNNPREPKTIGQYWISDQEKQNAQSFKMTEHKKKATKTINELVALANSYYLLSKY